MTATAESHKSPATEKHGRVVLPDAGDELLDSVLAATLANLGRRANHFAERIKDPAVSHLERAVLTARSVNRLRAEITDEILDEIYSLMNSQVGFKTDRPSDTKPAYSKSEVKECFIESLLSGLRSTGNEWNIIAGGMMIVLNGWRRKCHEIPGLSDLEVSPGVPRQSNGVWCVRVGATWQYQGKRLQLHAGDGEKGRTYAIPTHKGTSADAIVGKALRRAYRDVYQLTTGSDWLIGCLELEEAPPEPSAEPAGKTEALAAKLEARPATDVFSRPGEFLPA